MLVSLETHLFVFNNCSSQYLTTADILILTDLSGDNAPLVIFDDDTIPSKTTKILGNNLGNVKMSNQ